MALTPQEQAELDALEAELAPRGATAMGGLSPAEEAELQALEAEFAPQSAPATAPRQTKGWGEAIVENLPFGGSVMDVAQGKAPYSASPEGVGRAAGDIGTASGLGAAAMMLGGPVTAAGVGIGALAGAGLEKSGISPALREKAQGIRESKRVPFLPGPAGAIPGMNFEQKNFPSKVAGIPGLGQLLNLGQEGLKESLATPVDIVPSALAGLLSGLGIKGVQSGAARVAKGPAPLPAGAGLLEDAGVTVTPAMKRFAETGQRTGIPAAVENVSKANPLTAGMMEKIGKDAGQAVQRKVAAIPGAKMTTPLATGGALSKVMETFQKRRGTAVGAAKDALRGVEGGDVGKLASQRIINQLEQGGIPFDEAGFNVKLMKGGERMSPATAEALIGAERDLRGMGLGQAVNYLENFDAIHGNKLSSVYGNAATNAVKEARNLIKSTIMEAANAESPTLARALTEADRAYAISQPVVKPFLESARGMASDTNLASKLFGKSGSKADKSLRRLKSTMNPDEFGQVQDALASELLQRAGGVENMSLAKLKTALRDLGENRQYLKPGVVKALEEASVMMETADVANLGMPNPSGTANRLFNQLATVGGAAGAGAALSSPLPIAGYLGGSGLSAAYMKAPSAMRGAQRAIQPMAQRIATATQPLSAQGVAAGAALGTMPATLREAVMRSARMREVATRGAR
jgi:hypothetical protein